MGNEMSGGGHGHSHEGGESHGHSHGGEPCHGHGEAPKPAPQQHGHSHGGQPCHGHGEAPKPKPAPEQHGHSHGGKPCHGHGEAPKPAPQQHGHSHGGKPCHGHGEAPKPAPQQHGHSHGGKPCHGHGAPGEIPEGTDPQLVKKIRGIELFMKTMLTPKLPIIFEHFHPTPADQRKPETDVKSGTYMVPDNSAQVMNRDEFRKFVTAIQKGTATADGHGIVKVNEAVDMEQSFLSMLGFGAQAADQDAEVQIGQPLFLKLVNFILTRTCAERYDAIPYILQQLGLGDMKLPTLPMTDDDMQTNNVRSYARDSIFPSLLAFIKKAAEEHKDSEDEMEKCGLAAVLRSIDSGLEEAKSENEITKRVQTTIKSIPLQNFLPELKVHPADAEVNPQLLAHFITTNWVMLMLGCDPHAASHVFKQWGIELIVTSDKQ